MTPKHRNKWGLVCSFAAAMVLLIGPRSAFADYIRIVPDLAETTEIVADDLSLHGTEGWGIDEARVDAILVTDAGDEFVVTQSAIWISSHPQLAWFSEPGVLQFFHLDTPIRVALAASFGNATSEWTIFVADDPYGDDPPEAPAAPAAPAPDAPNDEPIPPEDLTDSIYELIDLLSDLGYPVPLPSQVDFFDEGSLMPWTHPWSLLGGDENAVFFNKGLALKRGRLIWVQNPGGIVVLDHEAALMLLSGDWFYSWGAPRPELLTLLHELLHAVLYQRGGQDLFDDIEDEEELIHHIENAVLPGLFQILNLLNNPEEWSPSQAQRLFQLLNNQLIPAMEWIKQHYPEHWREILSLLGWSDANDNHIPDFLERLIRQFLDWLYRYLDENPWTLPWDPTRLFGLFPDWDYPFCEDTDADEPKRSLPGSSEPGINDLVWDGSVSSPIDPDLSWTLPEPPCVDIRYMTWSHTQAIGSASSSYGHSSIQTAEGSTTQNISVQVESPSSVTFQSGISIDFDAAASSSEPVTTGIISACRNRINVCHTVVLGVLNWCLNTCSTTAPGTACLQCCNDLADGDLLNCSLTCGLNIVDGDYPSCWGGAPLGPATPPAAAPVPQKQTDYHLNYSAR